MGHGGNLLLKPYPRTLQRNFRASAAARAADSGGEMVTRALTLGGRPTSGGLTAIMRAPGSPAPGGGAPGAVHPRRRRRPYGRAAGPPRPGGPGAVESTNQG